MGKKFYRINQSIRALNLRVIDEAGKQIGILPLQEAQSKAREKGLDLVEVAAGAQPPVARITDFKKFLYQEEKRERESKKKVKKGELKGIRLSPFIAQADLDFRVRQAASFLKEGHKVRLVVRFSGRQLGKKNFGYEVLKKTQEFLGENAHADGEPKWLGRDLVLTLSPVKVKKKDAQTQSQKIDQKEV